MYKNIKTSVIESQKSGQGGTKLEFMILMYEWSRLNERFVRGSKRVHTESCLKLMLSRQRASILVNHQLVEVVSSDAILNLLLRSGLLNELLIDCAKDFSRILQKISHNSFLHLSFYPSWHANLYTPSIFIFGYNIWSAPHDFS